MRKHTPEPWVARKAEGLPGRKLEANQAWAVTTEDGDLRIATGPSWDDEFSGESWANARLIAAAPELLEALRIAEEALNHIRCTSRTVPWDQTGPAVQKARAAIAKAEGRE